MMAPPLEIWAVEISPTIDAVKDVGRTIDADRARGFVPELVRVATRQAFPLLPLPVSLLLSSERGQRNPNIELKKRFSEFFTGLASPPLDRARSPDSVPVPRKKRKGTPQSRFKS
ncbi:hypothetical protein OPV22_002631 [Ensete ventricosum]|uniref:Uncharacterized protein n=1 Tax=Ensete ventricosum TaxID=4639 RepID=A0AAV8RYJ1_ENSVE|nr:hypothetical protein OPV22_002631 [Ensete ventricosum]